MYLKKYLFIVVLVLFSWSSIKMAPLLASNLDGNLGIVYAQATASVSTQSGDPFYGENDDEDAVSKANQGLNKILTEGQGVFNGLIGLGMLSSIAAFAFTAFKLGQSGDAKGRAEAIKTLISIAIVTACLGGFPLLYSLVITSIF